MNSQDNLYSEINLILNVIKHTILKGNKKGYNNQLKVTKLINGRSEVLNNNTTLMNQEPQQFVPSNAPPEQSQHYVHEMLAMYQKNLQKLEDLATIIKQLRTRTEEVEQRIAHVESSHKKKKKRRTSAEIQKNFKCPHGNCEKMYGSDVSLNLHIKFKHGGINKKNKNQFESNQDSCEDHESSN